MGKNESIAACLVLCLFFLSGCSSKSEYIIKYSKKLFIQEPPTIFDRCKITCEDMREVEWNEYVKEYQESRNKDDGE